MVRRVSTTVNPAGVFMRQTNPSAISAMSGATPRSTEARSSGSIATHFEDRVKKVLVHNDVVLFLPKFDDSCRITSADFLKIHIHGSGWCHNERIAKKKKHQR
jgi:hypothetical protein